MKRRGLRRRFFRNRRLVLAVVFLAVTAFVAVEFSAARLLSVYGEHAATTQAQRLFADAVGEVCAEETFSDAVSLQTDEAGNVRSFSGNTALQNALQAKLSTALCDAFEEQDRVAFSVPLGTLFGDPSFSGRGPSVSFFVALSGSPEVTLCDEFTDAGINQTYHTVTAKAKLTVVVTALGKSNKTTLNLAVPVSQTAIVGDVPSVYVAF